MASKKDPAKKSDKGKDLDTGERNPLETIAGVKEDIVAERENPKPTGKGTGKKRGPYKKRKKAEPEPEPVENPFDTEIIGNVYALLFATISQKNGQPHWMLSDNEKQALAESTNAVIEKYLPRLGPYMVEVNFLITIGGIFGIRMYQTAQINKAIKAEKEVKQPEVENVAK